MIRAALGISDRANAARAAIDAAKQALDGLAGARPTWCIAFVSPRHGEHLQALLGTLAGKLETPYVAGCSASGVVAAGREIQDGPVVGLLAVASEQLRGTPFLFHDAGDHGVTAGLRLAQRFSGSTEDLLLVLPDPFHVRPDRLLQGLEALLDGVTVVGGAASGGSASGETFQFCGTESARSAVSGMRLRGRFRHVVGVTQGCRPLGEPLRITRCHDNLLLEIEGRPALDLLRERAPGPPVDSRHALQRLSVAVLPEASPAGFRPGEYLVRDILGADPDTGVLAIADSFEEGQWVLFVDRDGQAARTDLARMLARLEPSRTGLRYRFGLYFNCLARGRSLYDAADVDAAMLAEAFPGLPLLGFFSSAELGPLRGRNRVFTYTGVLLLVAE